MRIRFIICMTLLTITTELFADDDNFRFFRVDVSQFSADDVEDATGIHGHFSLPIKGRFYATGSIADTEFSSDLDTDIDYSQWQLGFGYHWSLPTHSDIYVELEANTQKLKADGMSRDQRGAVLTLGLKYRFSEHMLIDLSGQYSDIDITGVDDRSGDFRLLLDGEIRLTDNWQVGLATSFGGEIQEIGLYTRFSF